MIEYISEKIAEKIKSLNESETASVPVMKYALSIILNLIAAIALSIIFGAITGHIKETMLSLGSFALLRSLTGGFHFKSLDVCAVVSAVIFSLTPLAAPYFNLMGLSLVSVIFLSVLIKNTNKKLKITKILAIFCVLLNIFIGNAIIGLTFFIQSLTLIPTRR